MERVWIVGYLVSLVVGGLLVWAFLAIARRLLQIERKPESGSARVPPALTGIVERLFFTTLVAFNASSVATAMIGWLALKLATNWNHPAWKEKVGVRTQALLALLAGALSMLFAFIGGLICNGSFRAGA